MQIGVIELLIFTLYYIIVKAIFQVINIETRRNGWHVPAGVSGLLA